MSRLLAATIAACEGASVLASAAAQHLHSQAISPALRRPVTARQRLDSAARSFLDFWGTQWQQSQSTSLPASMSKSRARAINIGSRERTIYFHCHKAINDERSKLQPNYVPITTELTAFSVCPTWLLDDEPHFDDEDGNIDAAILPSLRGQVRAKRGDLITLLNASVQANPRDHFLVGQLVRFLLDQQLKDSAYAVTTACATDRWWCTALKGFVDFHSGRGREAEAAYIDARALMPATERCAWEDISLLAPPKFFQNNAESECLGRDQFNKQFWWMSDPLWSVPGNERRLDHDVRYTSVKLRSGFAFDGRSHWGIEAGGDALAKMLIRYGWPTYLAWGGKVGDTSHDSWLVTNSSPKQPPYTTYEYGKGRVHTAPEWEAVANPYAATDSSWQLSEPSNFSWRKKWWPEEFMKRSTPLAQLPRGQTAMLRRKADIIFALATDIVPLDSIRVRDGTPAALLVSTSPESLTVLESAPLFTGATHFSRGRIGPFPALIGLEARETISGTARDGLPPVRMTTESEAVVAEARTRFAIIPPSTLDEMRAGEVAISEPVLIRPAQGDSLLPRHSDALLGLMLGTVAINPKATPRVGVYWETYGVGPRDSVTVGVQVERKLTVGTVRRLGMALGLANNPNAEVNITWREPDIGRITNTIEGPVPIQSRVLVLDISRLEPGPYDLVMSIAKVRGEPVTNVKRIVILK